MAKFKRMHVAAVFKGALCASIMLPMQTNAVFAAEEPVPLVEANAEGDSVEAEDTDAAVLAWMENEMQMSIDLTGEPQGYTPDFSCLKPPYNCSANVDCSKELGGSALCVVTSCAMGECPACPIKNPGVLIKSWCAYGCMNGSEVVGGAFTLLTSWGKWLGPVCFKW
jgi:hypothetical protein